MAEIYLVWFTLRDVVRATAVEVVAAPVEVFGYVAEFLCPLYGDVLTGAKVGHGWRRLPARGNAVLWDKGA